jgi:glycosyltransferase involved in cell wall biosynthesis
LDSSECYAAEIVRAFGFVGNGTEFAFLRGKESNVFVKVEGTGFRRQERQQAGFMEITDNYQKGLSLAEEGKCNEALIYLQEHLRNNLDNAEVLNDIGAVLHCLGRGDEAVGYLLRARSIQPQNPNVAWNLVETYLAGNKPDEASRLFEDMERMGVLNLDVVNRTARNYLDRGNKSGAMEMLMFSLKSWPEQQELLGPMIEVVRSTRPKISFLSGLKGDVKFLTDILEYTKARYDARFCDVTDVKQLAEVMRSSDICWFEWCTDLVVEASKQPKVCKNIVRLHRFEAYGEWPSQVRWENIDYLILVGNSYVKSALLKEVPDIESRTKVVTIPNGVNLDRFRFANRQRGKNIACVGYLNMRKNPMFLIQCMQKLHYIDPGYRFYFAGEFQDYCLEQYIRHQVKVLGLDGVVFFDNWQTDMNGWLADKHFIVSGSIGESEGMGILEAMAAGLKPVVHNFPGAEEIFGSEFLFNISEEFCGQILSDRYEPYRYRSFVERRYPLKKQLAEINKVFVWLDSEIDRQKGNVPAAGQIKPAGSGVEGRLGSPNEFSEELNRSATGVIRSSN